MSNTFFDFKQFRINQEECAMKVGTDGVLLGAWAGKKVESYINNACSKSLNLLDIGTGTGLIALMLAQQTQSNNSIKHSITAIEIDRQAAKMAEYNINASPWKDRMHTVCEDVRSWNGGLFDFIVCNPPYFIHSLKSPYPARNYARHNDTLSFEELFNCSKRLLIPNDESGIFLIFPHEQLHKITQIALSCGFYPSCIVSVLTKPNAHKPERILAFYKFKNTNKVEPNVVYTQNSELAIEAASSTLNIYSADGFYSLEYKNLISDFYLKVI